ncbi:hypothetical protein ACHAW5_003203 [Stephanodiscus triporus]|uniref:DUF2786 domain-containing protein n=1 Tax=Stephanodiscus triporus TaxID=2934178 RepID=A0ABD3P6Z4_9STRA
MSESNSDGGNAATMAAAVAAGVESAPSSPSSDVVVIAAGASKQDTTGASLAPPGPTESEPRSPSPLSPSRRRPRRRRLIDVVDRLYHAADKDSATVGDIIKSVARHFNVAKFDKKTKRRLKKRLRALCKQAEHRVGVSTAENGKREGSCNDLEVDDVSDNDSDVQDISTRMSRASPEIIDLLDDSSDDAGSQSCFYEYDAHGIMSRTSDKGPTSQKTCNAASLFDDSSQSGASEDDEGGAAGMSEAGGAVKSDSDDSSGVEDVTELMLAKRNERARKMIEDAEEIDDDSDLSCAENQKTAGTKRRKVASSPSATKRRRSRKVESTIEVIIDEKDVPSCPGAKVSQDNDSDSSPGRPSTDIGAEHSIKQQIVKLLNTGFHGNSNEHEARNAMKLARRLMERYNLDQALVMQERGDGSLNDFSTANDDNGSALCGGIVMAKIRNRKSAKPLSSLPRWHDFLIQTVCMNFHVEAFKTLNRNPAAECSVTFYGIRMNAQLAAYAFKISSERCSLMAAAYEPPREMLSTRKQVVETKKARLSYALGIVNGLERDVKEGKRREEERRREELRRAQNASKKDKPYHQDGDSDNDGCDEEGIAHCQTTKKTDEICNSVITNEEANSNASEKIKVRSSRKLKTIALNRNAYDKGVIDSKEIDLNQQAIK